MKLKKGLARVWIVALTAAAAGTGLAATASAAPIVVACTTTITADTTLASDIGPCSDDGIRIGADNITLDLNGHSIIGIGGLALPHQAAGVFSDNHTGLTVKNGTIRGFYHGVRVRRGGRSTVTEIRALNNQGGNGITFESAADNSATNNVVEQNGRFSGISTFDTNAFPGLANRNTIANNLVRMNTFNGAPGISAENGAGHVIRNNTVEGSAADGIVLASPFGGKPPVTGASVTGNISRNNGRNGINVQNGTSGNQVVGNQAYSNAQAGIAVGGQSNRIQRNVARNNSQGDLLDSNPGGTCDANTWQGNLFGTAAPACAQS